MKRIIPALAVLVIAGAVLWVVFGRADRTMPEPPPRENVPLVDAPRIELDASKGRVFEVTLKGDRVLAAPANLLPDALYTFVIHQDAVGGHTLSFDPAFRFSGNLALPSAPVPREAGTPIGTLPSAAAFDGVTAQPAAVAGTFEGFEATLGKDWGEGRTRVVSRLTLHAPSDRGFGGEGPFVVMLEGSHDAQTWARLFTSEPLESAPGQVLEAMRQVQTSTAWRFHRVRFAPAIESTDAGSEPPDAGDAVPPSVSWSVAELSFESPKLRPHSTLKLGFRSTGSQLFHTSTSLRE